MSKGSTRRPMSIDITNEEFKRQWDEIFKNEEKKAENISKGTLTRKTEKKNGINK